MDIESIKSIWESWKEVQEKKTLDPVDDAANDKKFKNRKDKDIDNDGDVDSSDEFLHKKRKAIDNEIDGGEKPVKEEDEEDDSEEDDSEDDKNKSKKPKKGVNPFAKNKESDDEDDDDMDESSEMPEWLQVIGEKLKAMEESGDPVADEEEAYKDDKKPNKGIKKDDKKDEDGEQVDEISKGLAGRYVNKARQDIKNQDKKMDDVLATKRSKQGLAKFDKAARKQDNRFKGISRALPKARGMREESDNGEPTSEKMKGMRKEDFASEADWRVSSMREALAVMEANKQTQGASRSEPYDDTASEGEKGFVAMHKKSNPDLEDLEDNKAALPTGVKSQSPSRRGDNLNNGDAKKPKK